MNSRSRSFFVFGTIVALVGAYVAAYVLLALPHCKQTFVLNGVGPWKVIRNPDYRLGRLNVVIEKVFLPAYFVDTKVRPSFWEMEVPLFDFSRSDSDVDVKYVESQR